MPKIENKLFYRETICKEYLEQVEQVHSEQKEILHQIKDYEDRLSHMRDLLARRQIDAEDYREMKSQYNLKTSALESQLTKLNSDVDNIQVLIDQGLSKIMEINHSLENESLSEIRNDIGSIYPEKMHFDKNGVRTARRNDFIQHINLINKNLGAKKNGTKIDFSTLSRQVGVAGLLRDPKFWLLETNKSFQQFCKLLGLFRLLQIFEQARICNKQKIPSAMQKGFVRRGGRIRTCDLLLPKQAR